MSTIQLFRQNPQSLELEPLGRITEAQLRFLIDNLEEEFVEDVDYYIHRPTIDFLKERGADDELVQILERAIAKVGPDEGVEVVYRKKA
jgi:processive 1,2-diacylglycerol beta-glucosyltransferase